MAKFKYSMENILRIKERLEEQKRMALGEAIARYQTELDRQGVIEEKLKAYLDDFYIRQSGKMNGAALQEMSGSVAYYERDLKNQKQRVAREAAAVERKRLELKKALEERKIQEKLKEKAYEKFMEEEKHKEQQLLDEVVGYRYAAERED